MSSVIPDLRQAWRSLTLHRGFFTTALLTIALGVGANTAVTFEERRRLLETVLSNCTFDRGSLCPTYK